MPSLIVIGHISNLILMMERKVRIECDKQRKAKGDHFKWLTCKKRSFFRKVEVFSSQTCRHDHALALCKKMTIPARFFELDQDEERVWEDLAEFQEGDVHHQYAIVFKTPK